MNNGIVIGESFARGISTAIFDLRSGIVMHSQIFDILDSVSESDKLISLLNGVQDGAVGLMATADAARDTFNSYHTSVLVRKCLIFITGIFGDQNTS